MGGCQSLLGGGSRGQIRQGLHCWLPQTRESKGRKEMLQASGMASVLLSEMETSGREQIWQGLLRRPL